MHKIQSSLDWAEVETALLHQTSGLMYGADARAMIRNIYIRITELSKAEVIAQHRKTIHITELIDKINDEIDLVEGYILVAALIGKA